MLYTRKRTISTVFIIILLTTLALSKKQFFQLSRFIEPDTCWGCHDYIYKQWKNSMHSLAHKDPLYRQVSLYLLNGLTDKDELAEAESCPKCHTPLGVVSGFPTKTSDDHKKTPPLATHGVQCDFCHSSTGASQQYNNGHILDPGHGEENPGTKRGPYRDSESDFHKSEFSKFHTEAYFCGSCHDVKHVVFGTLLETTFDEWKKSPYNSEDPGKRVSCQMCHMRQRPGVVSTGATDRPENPGQAADSGPKRAHVSTHYFVGANRSIPGLFGDKIRDQMAMSRLQNAAEVKIDKTEDPESFTITITNTGAGHKLPTGLANVRQMWLEILVINKNGEIIFSSGVADKDGYLPENVIIYNTVFGDGDGKPVLNIAKARKIIKDRRILPKESIVETIKIVNPDKKPVPVKVIARLLYRSASQKLVDTITGKGKLVLPVTEMEKAEKEMSL